MDTRGLQDLRRALGERRGGRGVRVPATVKPRVMAYARRQRRDGATVRAIADDLGLSYETIRRWTVTTSAAVGRARPLPVAIVAAEAAALAPGAGRVVSVVSPTGFRVDGLSLDEAAALLRALA